MSRRPPESGFYEPSPLLRGMQILRQFAFDPRASQNKVARAVGLAPSMVHKYVHALSRDGFLVVHTRLGRGLRYEVTRDGVARLQALLRRYHAEAARLVELLEGRARAELEAIARDGVSSLGVVAEPFLAETLLRAASRAGLRARALGDGRDLLPLAEGAVAHGLDAVLFAGEFERGAFGEAEARLRGRGLRAYEFAPVPYWTSSSVR